MKHSPAWLSGRCRSSCSPLPLSTRTESLWHTTASRCRGARCHCCTESSLNSPLSCLFFYENTALPVTVSSVCTSVVTYLCLCGSWGEFALLNHVNTQRVWPQLMYSMSRALFCAVLQDPAVTCCLCPTGPRSSRTSLCQSHEPVWPQVLCSEDRPPAGSILNIVSLLDEVYLSFPGKLLSHSIQTTRNTNRSQKH